MRSQKGVCGCVCVCVCGPQMCRSSGSQTVTEGVAHICDGFLGFLLSVATLMAHLLHLPCQRSNVSFQFLLLVHQPCVLFERSKGNKSSFFMDVYELYLSMYFIYPSTKVSFNVPGHQSAGTSLPGHQSAEVSISLPGHQSTRSFPLYPGLSQCTCVCSRLTLSVASCSSSSAILRARSVCSSRPRSSSTSAARRVLRRSVSPHCSFSSPLWCRQSDSSSCRSWRAQ